jgi:hypothetical protein
LITFSSAFMMDAVRSSETSVIYKIRGGHMPEDSILYSYRRKNL